MVVDVPQSTIAVLPEEVASKIAAGEVVERPASVVRELVDNAIDAGASNIRVEIAGGGRTLIRVSDDGRGIPPEQMPRAFLRHATSKIRTAEDLWSVRTLGFRGEALFSIAAVSKTSLLSRLERSAAGYEMLVHAGQVVESSSRGAPAGTCVTVRELFYNLPARLKFLKSAPAEAAHITGLVQQYALGHPHIRFSLTNEGRTTFHSPGSGDLRTAAMCVYGSDLGKVLLPVGLEPNESDGQGTEEPAVYGYASPPAHSRSNRQAMHFFVNRRAVASRMLLYAVQEAYHSLLMVGRFPVCVLNICLDPQMLDVNVHPAKSEVKFRDERAVFSAVQRAVRSALAAHVPAPEFGSRGPEGWQLPAAAWPASDSAPTGWPQDRAEARSGPASEGSEPLPAAPTREVHGLQVVGQLGNTYIVAEASDGLYLIDQHAAHERVLYEQLGGALSSGGLAVQPLLAPLALECSVAEWAEAEPLLPLLAEFGFDIEAFGEHSLLVRSVPAVYAARGGDLGADLLDIIEGIGAGLASDRWREEMAITLACHSAVRAGQSLSLPEMRSLLSRLEQCRYPRSCAHGRPTMLHLSQAQLEREFGRRA